MKDLFYHPLAVKDAQRIFKDYETINAELGDRFWLELMEALEQIRRHPERCHFDETGKRRKNLKRFPFHVLYEERPKDTKVLVIKHHRRSPSYGMRR